MAGYLVRPPPPIPRGACVRCSASPHFTSIITLAIEMYVFVAKRAGSVENNDGGDGSGGKLS